jgi:uncharacterized protein YbjQ (UPF0145 family)
MKNLISALIKAQAEFPSVVKDATNPHFKNRYASLETVLDTISPILRKHGMVMIQTFEGDELRTTLYHESGEMITGHQKLLMAKADAQGFASSSSYARRYGALAIVGICSTDDDDGNQASKPTSTSASSTKPETGAREVPVSAEFIAAPKALRDEAIKLGNDANAIKRLHQTWDSWFADIDMKDEKTVRNGIEALKTIIAKGASK